jgi:hypothetical protein
LKKTAGIKIPALHIFARRLINSRAGVDTRPYVQPGIRPVGATVHGRPRADLNGLPSVGPYIIATGTRGEAVSLSLWERRADGDGGEAVPSPLWGEG